MITAPRSCSPGVDLGSVAGPPKPLGASAVASEFGPPLARGPQPPLTAKAQAFPKAIPNMVQALSTEVSPTLPALPKAEATTATARGAPLARDSQPDAAEVPAVRTPAKTKAPGKKARLKAKAGNAQSSGTPSVLHFFQGNRTSQE